MSVVVKHILNVIIRRCVELIICEQMNKYKARLKDINTLEFAECKAKSRLTIIRRSMVSNGVKKKTADGTETQHSNTHLQFKSEFALSYPSNPILSYPSLLLIQKPVVIAVRFMSITRSAAAVRTHSVLYVCSL